MMLLLLLAIFGIVASSLWFQGFWSAAISLVNLILAGLVASSYFEPVSTMLENTGGGSFTYLLDFVSLWLLFFLAFSILRLVTDGLSRTSVQFDRPVEMVGRSVLAAVCGWVMVCFVAFSLQMAPLNSESPLGAWSEPNAPTFLVVSPDRLWLRFLHSRSRGALARAPGEGAPRFPGEENVQAFDPFAEFPLKYRDRRTKFAVPESSLRINRDGSTPPPSG